MEKFTKLLQKRFEAMQKTGKLFRSKLTCKEVWYLYLNSFTKENNPKFRDPASSQKNCNTCYGFIKRYGNIVAINDRNEIMSIFDVAPSEVDDEFKDTVTMLSTSLREAPITEVFVETFAELTELPYESCKKSNAVFQLGIPKNVKCYSKEEAEKFGFNEETGEYKIVKPDELRTFNHMHLVLDKMFVDMSGTSAGSLMAGHRDSKEVFLRGMETIPLDTLNLVKDLINQGSLLDGTTHLFKIDAMIPLKREFDALAAGARENWAWVKSRGLAIAKFRNELMGTLCVELAEGKELNDAVLAWNKRVDPANYMKAVAPITKRQIEDAKKFVEENGYTESFDRRYATMEDIKASEILHLNSPGAAIKSVSMFDSVKPAASSRHKRSEFDGVEIIGIEKFMKDILPGCTSIEAFLTAPHEKNMVSLTTANVVDSKPIFKWDNNYSKTFSGNLAGKSQLAEMVVARGGKADGVFRFTHSWNELEKNQSLMDLHVFMPGCQVPTSGGGPSVTGRRVGWNNRTDVLSGGVQDVDYTSEAPAGYIPVENITFPSVDKMPQGVYTCKVHNWSFRRTGGKGKAEIAIGGEIFQYVYPATKNHEWITIAEVTLKDGKFSIKHVLPVADEISKEIYGLQSNEFHKVNLVCLSPNHWGKNNIGNKYYMFMLEGAKSPTAIRSFHNEDLLPELAEHRKVLEVLGGLKMLEPVKPAAQLSGLGFNATVRDEVVLKLGGTHKRVVKVQF